MDILTGTNKDDPETRTLVDKEVCMSITLDNGTGTMVDESELNSGITVKLGLSNPKNENEDVKEKDTEATG